MSEYATNERPRARSSKRPARRGRLSLGGKGLSTAALLDLAERLGVVDMVADRVKGRLEDVDIDALIDEVADYIKRNPEVLVVSLGAVTIATGAAVYLNKRKDGRSRATTKSSKGGSRTRSTRS
jgi:hypothetical protein